MGLDVSSASRKSSCATVNAESVSRIYEGRQNRLARSKVGTNGSVEHNNAFPEQPRENIIAAFAPSLIDGSEL